MTGTSDLLLLVLIVIDLWILSSSRLDAAIRASMLQGVVLALLPPVLAWEGGGPAALHILLLSGGTFLVKAVAIPALLSRSMRRAEVRREAEPFVSLHLALWLAIALVGLSFWLATLLALPRPAPSRLIVPAALSTLFSGFLILVARRKAISQVIGYLVVENGVFIFGQALANVIPIVVELGIFLDLLVGVFVMGIAIHHISREFDHIDTDLLVSLKD